MKTWHTNRLTCFRLLLLSLSLASQASAAPHVLVVDDFENRERNQLGGHRNTYQRAPSRGAAAPVPDLRGGRYSRVLRMQADRKAAGFCGVWLHLFNSSGLQPQFFDATQFKYLSFWVRGQVGGERLTIKLADQRWIEKEDSVEVGKIDQYLAGGITQQWQEVLVPLEGDHGLALDSLGGLTFDFDLPGQYTVYIDNVAFKSQRKVQRGKDSPPAPALPLPTIASTQFDRALWLRATQPVHDDTQQTERLLTFCRRQGISQLWMQLLYEINSQRRPGRAPQSQCIIQRADAFARLLRSAHHKGIEIHALAGSPEYSQREWHHVALAIVNSVVDFNRGKSPLDQFDGIHFDNQPHQLIGWHDAQRREQILFEFLSLNAECQRRIRTTSPQLQFGIDIPLGWQDRNALTDEPLGMVTFRGKRQAASYHAIELLDNVGIMNPYDQAHGTDGIIAHGRNLFTHLQDVKRDQLYLGVETLDHPPAEVIFVAGMPRDAFRQAIHGNARNLAKLSQLEGYRLRVFDDGTYLHVGLELPATLAPADRDRVTHALGTIGKQFGIGTTKLSAPQQANALEHFVRSLKRESEWSNVRTLSLADPQTGARQSVVRATANVSPKRTFANDGVGKFMQQLQQAENFFGQFDHYAGLAVHQYATYHKLLSESHKPR